jgi:UDP:flavonoid glycosyltransferase YjiC (YdhE family)
VLFVTQGTLANFDFNQLVNPTLAALAEEDVQVIVTAGGGPANTIATGANVIVEPCLSYELILPHTSVFVTNGGYNGVQQALSYGVPLISAGESEDKPQVCARVAWSASGISLRTGKPTPEQIRNAVREVLRDPQYREQAKNLGAKIAKTNALSTIAQIVESTMAQNADQTTRRPPESVVWS